MDENGKAFYLHRSKQKPVKSINYHCGNTDIASRSDEHIRNLMPKDKKSSIWNWKPLKALVHFGHPHVNCHFFLHVHAIEGLPPDFDNLNLCVTWKRKSDILRTRPVKVCSGVAEFEETLTHQCSINYGSIGTHQSVRYEQKLSLLRVFVIEAPSLDIGIQYIDLTRLLPHTLDELTKDKRISGKWTTSFRLTGKAKSAFVNVSLGFSLADGNLSEYSHYVKIPHIMSEEGTNDFFDHDQNKTTCKLFNLDNASSFSATASPYSPSSSNAKFLDGNTSNRNSELSTSLSMLYQKLEEGNLQGLTDLDLYFEDLESPKPVTLLSDETSTHELKDLEFDAILRGVEVENSVKDQLDAENSGNLNLEISSIDAVEIGEIFKEDEALFDENLELNSMFDTNAQDLHPFEDDQYKNSSVSIAIENFDSDLRDVLIPLDMKKYSEPVNDLDSMFSCTADKLMRSNSLNDIAESIENDFLAMLSTGMNQNNLDSGVRSYPPGDKTTQHENDTSSDSKKVKFMDDIDLTISPQSASKNYGDESSSLRSRRNAEVLDNLETEALMNEWGLSEEAFQYHPRIISGGFGSPVSIPDEEPISLPCIEEGIGPLIQTRDGGFLRSLSPFLFKNASNGARLIVQISAPVLFPAKAGCRNSLELLQHWASRGVQRMCIQINELMPLEDFTGKTMLQILSEAESTHNSFTRSNKVDPNEDPESFEDLVPVSMAHIEGLLIEGLQIQAGMGIQEPPTTLSPAFDGLNIDEFIKCSFDMKQSITLDTGTKPELVENNFIMALRLQLRDPLRDYEMVGSPMLAVIQAEKVSISGGSRVVFRFRDGHVAGFDLFKGKKVVWGSKRQDQSGRRWLLSSGMVKGNKKNCGSAKRLKDEGAANVVWSITCPDEATEWNERIALNVHSRNPDIVFPVDSLV